MGAIGPYTTSRKSHASRTDIDPIEKSDYTGGNKPVVIVGRSIQETPVNAIITSLSHGGWVRREHKMSFKCPKCHKIFKPADEIAGKPGKCPGCGHVLVAPSVSPILAEEEIAAAAVQSGPYTEEWKSALRSLASMSNRQGAVALFADYLNKKPSAIAEVCGALAKLDTVRAVEPLLRMFRNCEPSILTQLGDFYNEPTADTLGPSGCKDDHYPARALVSTRGSLLLLKELCSIDELERILILGNHPYGGYSNDPEVIQAIADLATPRAAGLLLFILMQEEDDKKAKQSPAFQSLVSLANRSPLLVKSVGEREVANSTGAWKRSVRKRMKYVLAATKKWWQFWK